jgi:hypothetical protein
MGMFMFLSGHEKKNPVRRHYHIVECRPHAPLVRRYRLLLIFALAFVVNVYFILHRRPK